MHKVYLLFFCCQLDKKPSSVKIGAYEKHEQTNLLLLLFPFRLRDWFVFNNNGIYKLISFEEIFC